MLRSGTLAGPIAGLRFETPTCSGTTDDEGTFQYRESEVVVFSVGTVVLGAARGARRLTVADIVARVDGNIDKIADPGLTNIARFLQSLDRDGNPDNGITLTPEIHELVGDRAVDYRYGLMSLPGAPADPVEAFTDDPVVSTLLEDLNRAGFFTDGRPRTLRSPAAARNEIRRNILGIRRYRDVAIPLRNGSVVYADVYRPDGPEPVPVVMNCGVYGRAFVHHSIGSPEDAEHHEVMEERYFLGNPDGYEYENHESINSADWVPRGYALVRVDSPGAGTSPGTLGIWGIDEAEAYYDAIEWAAAQPWSNGNVGLWGMSLGMALVPKAELRSMDDWDAMGLAATGSQTVAIDGELFVPDELTRHGVGPRRGGIARSLVTCTGVALGMADHALEVFTSGVRRRSIPYSPYASQLESPITHHAVGRAHVQIRAAGRVAEAALAELDRSDAEGADPTEQEALQFHTDAAFVWDACSTAIETLFQASGASAITKRQPLQLIARNCRAGSMHAAHNLDTWLENTGRDLCGAGRATLSTSVLEKPASGR